MPSLWTSPQLTQSDGSPPPPPRSSSFRARNQLIPADTRDVYDAGRYAVLWWHAIEARVAMRGVRERAVRSIRIARLLTTKK